MFKPKIDKLHTKYKKKKNTLYSVQLLLTAFGTILAGKTTFKHFGTTET